MKFERSAGVLLHPTSLPSRYGIGDLGDGAYQFVNFLEAAQQQLWQVLPLGPTGYGDSPYQSFSAFAGNPMLISPDRLVSEGFLPAKVVAEAPSLPTAEVDFGPVIEYKTALLRAAYEHFRDHGDEERRAAFDAFCAEAAFWLDDFALFMALKEHHKDVEGGMWAKWPKPIRTRQAKALKQWTNELSDAIMLQKYQQFLFYKQWLELKAYANEKGIRIIGDIPIFVAYDSADVWSHPDLFYMNDDGSPSVVAGVPPDYFSETGQRWGNPLYRWDVIAADNYQWWAQRIQINLLQADIVRIDHFRGFEGYWEIPASEPTAVKGQWVKGPGIPFFEAMQEQLGELPIIAEDLGVITPEVEELRDRFAMPGMKILQFAFGGEQNSDFLPFNYTRNSVVYTGTHDNETTLGWYLNAREAERDHVRRYLQVSGRDIVWDLIRLAYASVSAMAIIPMQDLFVLGNEARMNYPGKEGGWWRWRYTREMFAARAEGIAMGLADLAHLYGRAPVKPEEEEIEEEMATDQDG
ncbi:4-alpha-glucanotransferase [Promineifilum sp.]|uniref:4-alpha-glucanotransferase n=1 Tax=Promineifilum sp. TaxID=2664178 RepID=UPI0035AE1234